MENLLILCYGLRKERASDPPVNPTGRGIVSSWIVLRILGSGSERINQFIMFVKRGMNFAFA